jgi:hypothetical protein
MNHFIIIMILVTMMEDREKIMRETDEKACEDEKD